MANFVGVHSCARNFILGATSMELDVGERCLRQLAPSVPSCHGTPPMKPSYSHSFNRRWHVTWSWKQFCIGFTIEFENVFILCLGFFSITYIRPDPQPKGGI